MSTISPERGQASRTPRSASTTSQALFADCQNFKALLLGSLLSLGSIHCGLPLEQAQPGATPSVTALQAEERNYQAQPENPQKKPVKASDIAVWNEISESYRPSTILDLATLPAEVDTARLSGIALKLVEDRRKDEAQVSSTETRPKHISRICIPGHIISVTTTASEPNIQLTLGQSGSIDLITGDTKTRFFCTPIEIEDPSDKNRIYQMQATSEDGEKITFKVIKVITRRRTD